MRLYSQLVLIALVSAAGCASPAPSPSETASSSSAPEPSFTSEGSGLTREEAIERAREAAPEAHGYEVRVAKVGDLSAAGVPRGAAPGVPPESAVWYIVLADPDEHQGVSVVVDFFDGEILGTVIWIE